VVTTAGGVVFWGDLNRRFFAFDAKSGETLWQTAVGGSVSVSTITYAVNGKQYVAVLTGDGQLTASLLPLSPNVVTPPKGQNGVYVFALPDKK
jgi:alcohol dehydrogenase (cytochrome c)